ncbi:MAG: response regulator transcription factor [Dehalococcoidia bacterium]|nr:response regulator transcription factor [Dehalococcoidia bacterium]
MPIVLFLAPSESKRELVTGWLREAGIQADAQPDASRLAELTGDAAPKLLALDVTALGGTVVESALARAKEWQAPVLAFVGLDNLDNHWLLGQLGDFALEPVRPLEFVIRVQRLLRPGDGEEGHEVVRVGDLSIDHEKYEVRVAGVIKVLTYKEYELLRLLVSNPGRVFTREELLSKVWGYDYFGGTRTVDVHVRRLRSKIEDLTHSFVETIWNVGYRFKAPSL